ncbi:helix-turn-helix transcriptional regulator [Maricaulis sp.]|uniref:helix-turn-helix transcriptional regulator n=1 Tax=Maricaulis sp. TaxID=1486257 RepID=UPI003A95AA67
MTAAARKPEISPRGLNRSQAAAYIGVSPGLFDEMVNDGRMPPSREINARRVWDIREVDMAFDDLPHAPRPANTGATNPLDQVGAI